MTPLQRRVFRRITRHLEYIHPRDGTMVELHERLCKPASLYPYTVSPGQTETATVNVGGRSMTVLSGIDLLFYLAIHGADHLWSRLLWVNDLAECMRQRQGEDWNGVLDEAIKRGAARSLVQGAVIANLLLEAPLPPSFRTYSESDTTVQSLVERALNTIAAPPGEPEFAGGFDKKLYVSKLRPEIRYKAGLLAGALFFSTKDWTLFRLPGVLFPLYFVSRPFVWLAVTLPRELRTRRRRRRTPR